MAVPAETLTPTAEFREPQSRRTDDILFNVRYLMTHYHPETDSFDSAAEQDVVQQDITEIAEADIHKLAPIVHQLHDPELGQYVSLGDGTVDNNITGLLALGMEDADNHFEFFRRVEEVTDEVDVLEPPYQEPMRAGAKKVFISASPTHHEVDPDMAIAHGYDDRAMLRIQKLSSDGRQKSMQSFTIFDAPAGAWSAFLSDRYQTTIEPTALAVMQFCNDHLGPQYGSTEEILKTFLGGVMNYVGEEEKENLQRQINAFINEQAELAEQANYYAKEKKEFEKELARSWLQGHAQPAVKAAIENVRDQLKPEDKVYIAQHTIGDKLRIDERIAQLAIRLKTVTVDNRAGMATLNERTIQRVASKLGVEAVVDLASQERYIQQLSRQDSDVSFMTRRTEQLIAEAGLGCGGGCSVEVVDLFSAEAETAKEAGLEGTLYESTELNEGSKCHCPKKAAKVISDGKNVVCVTCGEYQVNGKRGSLKKAKQAM